MILSDVALKYDAFQSVEIQIPASTTQTKFPFPNLPYLQAGSAKIKAIEIYTRDVITNSPISKVAVNTVAELQKISLTLYGGKTDGNVVIKQGNQIVQEVPVMRLNQQQASGTPYNQNVYLLDSLDIDWTKSFIEYAAAPANGSNAVVLFGVYFDWTDKQFN